MTKMVIMDLRYAKKYFGQIAPRTKLSLDKAFSATHFVGMNDGIIRNLRSVKADLEKKLSGILAEADILKSDIEATDRMIARYEGQTALPLEPELSERAHATEYKNITLRKAILIVLEKHKPRSLSAPEISQQLLAGGFKTGAEDFKSAVWSVLSTLVKVDIVEKAGPGQYRAKGRHFIEEQLDK
jgi:hypothetical protein